MDSRKLWLERLIKFENEHIQNLLRKEANYKKEMEQDKTSKEQAFLRIKKKKCIEIKQLMLINKDLCNPNNAPKKEDLIKEKEGIESRLSEINSEMIFMQSQYEVLQEIKEIETYHVVKKILAKCYSANHAEKNLFKKFTRPSYEREQAANDASQSDLQVQADVYISNIFVVQKKDSPYHAKGEFYLKDNNSESGKEVINRMYGYIQLMVDKAKAIHLKNNFSAPGFEPLIERKNDITRIAFHEFNFYPSQQRDPFSEEDFDILIQKITNLAKNCPINLHILLASFPVKNETNRKLENRVCYVECGNQPKVSVVKKLIPSKIDLVYPNKILPYFSGGSLGDHVIKYAHLAFYPFNKKIKY